MATIKLYLDKRSQRRDGTFQLKISLTHNRKSALLPIGITLLPSQWNEKTCKVSGTTNNEFLNGFIARRKLEAEIAMLRLIEENAGCPVSIQQIKERVAETLNPEPPQEKRGTFVEAFIRFAGSKSNPRTREIYESTLSRLRKFRPGIDKLGFEDITKAWLTEFDAFLAKTSPSRNARNIHFRNIRAVFNEAIDNEETAFYPFRKFKLKGEPTAKRALTAEQLRTVFDFPVEPHQEKYRDMFKLIFLLIGINTVDLIRLKEEDLCNGRITYKRAKTGRLYDLKVEPEAQALIDKYRGEKYLLNVLDRYANYRDYTKRLNDNLQLIGPVETGKQGRKVYRPMFPKLTTYWARHSWATIAASLDIPKETIAAALGHGGNTVTDIYIDFDRRKVDEANRRVLDWVLHGEK